MKDDAPAAPLTFVEFDGVNCGPSCADETDPACSCTSLGFPTNGYWSATPMGWNPSGAWWLAFSIGWGLPSSISDTTFARLVRGGPPPHFIDNTDGTITDNVTGLTWEKKTELDGTANPANLHDADNEDPFAGTCSIATDKLCQPDATAAALCVANVEHSTEGCEECLAGEGTCSAATTAWTLAVARSAGSLGGHTDWRVPTRAELRSIIDFPAPGFPAMDPAFHGADCGAACTNATSPACSCVAMAGPDNYWSATSIFYEPHRAWNQAFLDGLTSASDKDLPQHTRLVRGGP